MADYNKVILMGKLTRDPELKYTQSQIAICTCGIAASEKFTDASGQKREKTCFIDLIIWKQKAESFQKFFQKGNPVLIEGKINHETWEDKNGGGKRSKHSITVESFTFVGGGKKDGNAEQAERKTEVGGIPAEEVDPADIPF